jgi:hypothetical protein
MKSMARSSLLILAGFLCVAAPKPSWADQFATVDGQGVDPLLDAYSFFMFPNSSKIARIMFEATTWPDPVPVTLDVTCCTDFASGASVHPTDVKFEATPWVSPHVVSLPDGIVGRLRVRAEGEPAPPAPASPTLGANQFLPVAGAARFVGLKVTAGANAQPGRYVATVTARAHVLNADHTSSTSVIVTILPHLVEGVTPSCAAFASNWTASDVSWGPSSTAATLLPPTNPMTNLIKDLHDKKAANPAGAGPMDIGWRAFDADNGDHAIQITVAKSNVPLSLTQAVLVFVNSTSEDKQFIAFNNAICVPVATLLVKSGEQATLLVDAMTTNILLRRKVSGGWQSLSPLNEPPLWTLLSGRAITFTWLRVAGHDD